LKTKVAETEKKSEDLVQEWTGERYLPEIEGEIAAEHLHRYALVREIVEGKDVLDITSGKGYGSNMLRDTARLVIGVDCDEEAIRNASARYTRPALEFRVGSCDAIPLENLSVDVVVSFEAIERNSRNAEMLEEIKRVLRPGGILIISSPGKYECDDLPGSVSPFHAKALYLDEFHSLLKAKFRHIAMFGQRVDHGSVIVPVESEMMASWNSVADVSGKMQRESGEARPLFFIAIASDGPLPSLPPGIVSDLPFGRRRALEAYERLAEKYDSLKKTMQSESNSKSEQIAAYQRQAVQFADMLKSAQNDLNSAQSEIVSLRQFTADNNSQIQSLRKVGR
jgi:SAM-dependent methyltransferase